MVRFFNSDETGIEGIVGKVGNVVKTIVKSTTNQISPSSQDIVNQLYGIPSENQDQNGDQGVEGMGQSPTHGKAAQKGKVNAHNPAMQQAAARRQQMAKQGYKPEEIDKLEALRKKLHDEYFQSLTQPKKKHEEEERPAEKREKEEQEKKQKEQQKQQEEAKKKEDLKVVQERTRAERRPGAG